MHHTLLIDDLAVVLCVAAIVTLLFQKINQPTVLGYIIAGIIVGPYTPPFSYIDDEAYLKVLAQLGVIFLMFSIGLEFSIRKLTKVGLPALIIAIVEVALMILIGYGAGKFLGWSSYESLLLGAAISISSTMIIIKALENLGLKKQYFADLMIGVLLIEDLLAILLLVFISTNTANQGSLTYQVLSAGFKLILVIGSWILLGYFAIPYIMRKIQHYITHETLVITSVGLCLLLSAIGISFDYSAALGAFIMGSILAVTPQSKRIETLTLPIRDIFAAVFFVTVGMLIDPFIIYTYFPFILLLSVITIAGKIFASGIGALISGESSATSLKIGFGMAQIGEFSFIIVGLGAAMAPINEVLFPIIVSIAVITTFTTPYLMKLSVYLAKALEEKAPQKSTGKYAKCLHGIGSQAKRQFAKGKEIIRFIINGIIIAIICTAVSVYLIPHFTYFTALWPVQMAVWSLVLLAITPFVWAMIFASKTERGSKILQGCAGIAVAGELCLLIVPFLKNLWMVLPLSALMLLFIWIYAKTLKETYFWMEKHLIKNLSSREDEEEELIHQLAPWDNEFMRLTVLSHFPFIGKTLTESRLRPAFGINIIAIKRELKTIWLPAPSERIFPNDELIILGDRSELDQFKDYSPKEEAQTEEGSEEQMELETIAVKDHRNLINKKISDAGVREEFQGIIVGLEREGERILNPPANTLLAEGDVLLIIAKK